MPSFITPYEFCCHHIIPLVYDDSLSVYEALCKMNHKLNEIVDSNNALWCEYQKIIDYINTIMVDNTRDQVKIILEEWLKDGTLQNMIDKMISYSIIHQPFVAQQGSSYAIETSGGNIIIDFMNTASAETLIAYYKSKNITSFTTAIITHFHQDHFGDLEKFISAFDFNNCTFYLPTSPNWSLFPIGESRQTEEAQVIAILESHNIAYMRVSNGQVIKLNDNLKIEFYNCDASKYAYYYQGNIRYNDFSMITKFYNRENVVLFTGDIEKKAMENNLELLSNVKILQMPHHGYQFTHIKPVTANAHTYMSGWIDNMPLEMIMTQSQIEGFGTNGENIVRSIAYMYYVNTGVPYYMSYRYGNVICTLNGFTFSVETDMIPQNLYPQYYQNIMGITLGQDTISNFLNFSLYDYVNASSPTINPDKIYDLNNVWYIEPNTYYFNTDITNNIENKPSVMVPNKAFYMITKQFTPSVYTQTIYQEAEFGQVVYTRKIRNNSSNYKFSEWVMNSGGFGWVTLPNETDLNNIIMEGTYQMLGSNVYENMPNYMSFYNGNSSATLKVFQQNNQARYRQEIESVSASAGYKFVRYYTTNNQWTVWQYQIPMYLSSDSFPTSQLVKGTLRFNIETKNLEFWNGSTWKVIATN